MDSVIKEELYRSILIFGAAFLFSLLVIEERWGASFFTMLVFPVLMAFIFFALFVLIRKKSSNGVAIIAIIMGIVSISIGVGLSFLYRSNLSNIALIIIGVVGIIYGISKLKK